MTDLDNNQRQAWFEQLGEALAASPACADPGIDDGCAPTADVTPASQIQPADSQSWKQAWPWVTSGAGLCLAVMLTPPPRAELPPTPPDFHAPAAPRVQGWHSSERSRRATRDEDLQMGYYGVALPKSAVDATASSAVQLALQIPAIAVSEGGRSATKPSPALAAETYVAVGHKVLATQRVATVAEAVSAPVPVPVVPSSIVTSAVLVADEVKTRVIVPVPSWGFADLSPPPPVIAPLAKPATPAVMSPVAALAPLPPQAVPEAPITSTIARPLANTSVKPISAAVKATRVTTPRQKSSTAADPADPSAAWRDAAFFKQRN